MNLIVQLFCSDEGVFNCFALTKARNRKHKRNSKATNKKPSSRKRQQRLKKIKVQARKLAVAEMQAEAKRKRDQVERRDSLGSVSCERQDPSELGKAANEMVATASKTQEMIAKQMVMANARESKVKKCMVDLAKTQAASKAVMRNQVKIVKAGLARQKSKSKGKAQRKIFIYSRFGNVRWN